jgi:hypothetical protein
VALSSRGQFIAQAFAQIACFAKLRHPEADRSGNSYEVSGDVSVASASAMLSN